jgi:hypothetical protein
MKNPGLCNKKLITWYTAPLFSEPNSSSVFQATPHTLLNPPLGTYP